MRGLIDRGLLGGGDGDGGGDVVGGVDEGLSRVVVVGVAC